MRVFEAVSRYRRSEGGGGVGWGDCCDGGLKADYYVSLLKYFAIFPNGGLAGSYIDFVSSFIEHSVEILIAFQQKKVDHNR